jgi:hypothetical protein
MVERFVSAPLELSPAILADEFSRVDLMFFLTRLYTRLQQLGPWGP